MTTPPSEQGAAAPLPCPFCGAVGMDFGEGSTFRWITATCSGCGATTGETRIQTFGEGSRDEWLAVARNDAIAAWNRRASLPSSEGAGWIDLPALPEAQMPVLLNIGKKYPIRAMWVEAKTLPAGGDDDDGFGEYSEADDEWYCPAGWYEWNHHEDRHWSVSATPVRWMRLPAPGAAPVVEPAPLMLDETPEQVFKRVMAEADACTPCLVTPADAVEFRREAYGFTQAQMAKVLGMQQSHYSEFVNGRRELPRSAIRRATAIGVPASALLGFPEPVVEPGAQAGREAEDAERSLDLLAILFDAYENGPACYEDPDDCTGFLGNAVRLSNDDFHKCADLLNRRRPVAARATQGDRT